jgi:hypothetical protein
MRFHGIPWSSMRFYDVPVNRSVPTEANRGLTSYNNAAATPSKRARRPAASGSASQPILAESQLSQPRQAPRKAIRKVSQASNFESQLRKTQSENTVVAPTESSKQATAASSAADEVATYEEFEASLMDNFEGLDFSLSPCYIHPALLQSLRKSWIYRYGWRVALLRDPSKLYFVCRYCYGHKITPTSRIYETTRSTTVAAQHLEEQKHGHDQNPPGKTAASTKVSWSERMLKQNSGKILQTAANELLGFNTKVGHQVSRGAKQATHNIIKITFTLLQPPISPPPWTQFWMQLQKLNCANPVHLSHTANLPKNINATELRCPANIKV